MTMRHIIRCAAATAFSAVMFIALRCASINPANTSEVGNPKLSGHIVDGRDKTPAESALVRIYPVYLNKMAQVLGKTASGAPAIDSSLTNNDGYYQFENLASGIYAVEAEKIDGTDTLSMRHSSIIYIDDLYLGYDTLKLPGSIKGKIVVSGENVQGVISYIPGTSYSAITDSAGNFRITGIPAGTYSLSFLSSRFNDTAIYYIHVTPNRETDVGNILLTLDRSKNEHDVWGIFDTTADCSKVSRIEARVTGDCIPADSPRVYSLDWRPDVAGYSGFIYLPSGGLFWKVAVWVYDSLDHRIGACEITISRSVGDIQFPTFNPCNGIPVVSLGDTTVSIYDTVRLRPEITGFLSDDSIVSMGWDIGNTGTFSPVQAGDTTIIAPGYSAAIPCVFQITDKFGNAVSDTSLVTVVIDPPVVNVGNDTMANANDSISVPFSANDGYGVVVKYRFDTDGDGAFEDSSTIAGDKKYLAPSISGKCNIIVQIEDDDGNRSSDTMSVRVVLNGMMAYWSFDSVSGNTYYDVTDLEFDAVSTGTNIGIDSGIRGNALNCTGSGFDCPVADSKDYFCLNTFSIEAWFYPNAIPTSSNMKILDFSSNRTGSGNGYNLDIAENGFVRTSIWSPITGYWVNVYSTTALVPDRWYHLSVTYDGSYLRMYVNGVPEATVARTGGTTYPVEYDARIGCQKHKERGVWCNADGRIDELKLYNYALPADSIFAHFNNP